MAKKKRTFSVEEIDALESDSPGKRTFSVDEIESLESEAPQSNYNPGTFDSPDLDALRNGILMGYGPQFEAAVEYLVGKGLQGKEKIKDMVGLEGDPSLYEIDPYLERRDRVLEKYAGHKENYPKTWMAGNIGGGVLGAVGGSAALKGLAKMAGVGLPAANALTAGQRIKAAGATGAGMGAVANPGDTPGELSPIQAGPRLRNAAIGAGTGLALQGAVEGVGAGVRGLKRGMKSIGEDAQTAQDMVNIDELQEAADRLGIELTPGMKSQSMVVDGLESSLDQSPSFAGAMVRSKLNKTRRGFQDTMEDLVKDATEDSAYDVGSAIKKNINLNVGEKATRAGAIFDELRQAAGGYNPGRRNLSQLQKQIGNMKQVRVLGNPAATRAAKKLGNVKTMDDLVAVRQELGGAIDVAKNSGDTKTAGMLGEVYDRLTKFEENTLKRAIIGSGREAGDTAQAGLALRMMRKGKKDYSTLMDDLGQASRPLKTGRSKSPEGFLQALEKRPAENVMRDMTNMKDVEAMEIAQKLFPDEFQMARGSKLGELSNKLKTKEGMSLRNTVRMGRGNTDEAIEKIFGPGSAQKMKDLGILADAIPDKIGPSGTPQGQQFNDLDIINPIFQVKELGRYGKYKALQSPKVVDFTKAWADIPTDSSIQNIAFDKPGWIGATMGLERESLDNTPDFVQNPMTEDEKIKQFIENN